jgi:hypothetical protein
MNMPVWVQHILVLLVVAGAAVVLVRQGVASLRGRGGKIGSCCAKGCASEPERKVEGERIVFLPVESLTRSSRRS